MRLGLLTAPFPETPLADVVDWTAANGFESIEIACWPRSSGPTRRYAGTSHIDVANLSAGQATELADEIAGKGLTISGLGYYPNPLHPDAAHRDTVITHLRHVITAAEKMNVPFVNTFMGADGAKNQDDNWQEALKVWPDIVAFAKDHGRQITIENCPMLFSYDEWPGGHNLATTPRIWRRILEEWGGTIGLNFDPSHLILQMIDIPRFIGEFGPHILHVQAKDLMIDREGPLRARHLLAGHRLADPAPARARRRRVGSPVRRPVARRLRRRRDHRARGSRLRKDRRPHQARLPALARRPPAVHQVSPVPAIDIDTLTERDIAKAIDHSLLRPELDDAFVDGRVPPGGRVRRRFRVRAAGRCGAREGDPRAARTWRSGRWSASRTATTDRDEGLRGEAGHRRRRDRARHGHPDRRPEVGPRRRCPGRHPRGRRVAHAGGAIVKVIFENAYLTDDEKIRACRLSEAAGGRLRQDLDRLRAGRRHPRRPAADAREHIAHIGVKAAGGRANARRAARGHGARHDAHRRHGHEGHHRRLPGAQGRPCAPVSAAADRGREPAGGY